MQRYTTARIFRALAGMGGLVLILMGMPREAPAQGRPNILIAISDDQSYPHASAYGSTMVRTPGFDRVAAAGVLFDRAFVASPGCSPSRAALLTGRYPWELREAGTHASSFPADLVVFPDLLEAAGYRVGFTGKGWGPGDWAAGGRARNPAGDAYNTRRHEAPEGISPVDYSANFADFLASREAGQPFYFWYGAHEPHRVYKPGIGRAHGKPLAAAEVPPFLPDAPEVRDDLLDYAYEIEWFDAHLVQMLKQLEEAGELANTIVIVTSDNGMSFPRAKANAYEYGIHVPLAVMWPARVPGGRRVDDLVSLVDIAPTLLAAANVPAPAMTGTSLMPLLLPAETGGPEPGREAVFAARERHSSSRYNSLGYPQRAMRTGDALYIWNPAPERWPAGAPQAIGPDGAPGPLHGAYHDIDAAPTLDFLVAHRDEPGVGRYFHLAVDHRPARELCAVTDDPGCLVNLAGAPTEAARVGALHARLLAFLQSTGDPRALGEGDVFETYRRYSPLRTFPPPQWVLDGQPAFKPDWIDE